MALKLVPGQGVNSMKPVRITTPGAAPALPLRMVAAGTGEVTPIILWVFGDGRYEPSNFPHFTISEDELYWDWTAQKSNYSSLRDAKFTASNGFGWLTEYAMPSDQWMFYSLEYDAGLESYADADGMNAQQNMEADRAALYGYLSPEDGFFVTRMMGQLSRPALATDLTLGASVNQDWVYSYLVASNTVGSPPECPPDPCGDGSGGSGNGGGSNGDDDGGCNTSSRPVDSTAPFAALGLVGLLAALRKRRRS
ncbi:MAG: DUF2330 domain-containing protein [Polyangiaceae bacterium]|nr:DUF2330 domain-containing protein [Polyangiaceae bacterium]